MAKKAKPKPRKRKRKPKGATGKKGAPKGNEYWMLRVTHGREKIYKTPELLAKAITKYFEWCANNPLYEAVLSGKSETIKKVPKRRVFCLEGMCTFIGMSCDGFRGYERRKDFVDVTTQARQIIYRQKFEGASSGFFNANIIARDLGLKDSKDIQHSGEMNILPHVNIGLKVHKVVETKKKD